MKDPTVVIFTNRMKKARQLASLLIHYRVGAKATRRMTDDQWMELDKARQLRNGREPEDCHVGPITRRLVAAMMDVRWKVKREGVWI